MKKLILKGALKDLPEIAEKIIKFAGEDYRVWTFKGDLGAGKTTLIKEICRRLGAQESVVSPTFSLVNEYETSRGDLIYHFDFYRLKDVGEVLDIGTEEYFTSGNFCFVEWPQVAEPLLEDNYLDIQVEPKEDIRVFLLEKK